MEVSIVAGLAAFWLWYGISIKPLPGIQQLWNATPLRVLDKIEKFFRCPWCFGAWLAIGCTLLLSWFLDSFTLAVIFQALAAAAIVGVLGSIGLVDDDWRTNN